MATLTIPVGLRRNSRRWLGAAVASVVFLMASTLPVLAESASGWLQNHRETTLWSGPDANAVAFGSVPIWSGFQYLGAQGDRVMVRYVGNGVDRDPGIAWVDRADVGPTEKPLLWVAARQPAGMWSGPDDRAARFGYAPEEALMVRTGPFVPGRAQVYFLGSGGQAPGLIWVEIMDLRPATAPPPASPLWTVWGEWEARVAANARRLAEEAERLKVLSVSSPIVALAQVSASPAITAVDQQRFIDQVGGAARRMRTEIGLPPSLVTAMAINESGWGKSELATRAFNLFGIKAHRGAGTAGVIEMDTWEVIDGKTVAVRAPFRVYRSFDESLRDLASFLRSNQRYDPVWKVAEDAAAAADALFKAGYATDPAWTGKLVGIIDRNKLKQLDS